MLKSLFMAVSILLLVGCSAGAPSEERIEKLSRDIAVFQSDPEIINFLATEAAGAGVPSIGTLKNWKRELGNGRVSVNFGVTLIPSRRIDLAPTRAGGSVVNITHEIAHAYSHRQGCGCHTKEWIEAYLGIAERFEARFPGRTWSGQTPTQRVLRNVRRYGIKM